jgi:hypothetical protein
VRERDEDNRPAEAGVVFDSPGPTLFHGTIKARRGRLRGGS